MSSMFCARSLSKLSAQPVAGPPRSAARVSTHKAAVSVAERLDHRVMLTQRTVTASNLTRHTPTRKILTLGIDAQHTQGNLSLSPPRPTRKPKRGSETGPQ
jgi:hypothetical protein